MLHMAQLHVADLNLCLPGHVQEGHALRYQLCNSQSSDLLMSGPRDTAPK